MGKTEAAEKLEHLGTAIDGVRGWFSKTWRIGRLMAKGGYLLSERRRLFVRLGEEVYYRMMKGEFENAELEPLVKQLERLTKKVEIEEMLIRSIRFGNRNARGEHRNAAHTGAMADITET